MVDTKDQITVILKEYDALRKDIEDRVNTPKLFFVPLLFASLAGILGWKVEIPVELILFFIFPLLLTILSFALNADFYVLRAAIQVAKIEDKIFRLSGLSLLTHETEILHSRRQFHERKAALVGAILCIFYLVIEILLFYGFLDRLVNYPARKLILIFVLVVPLSMFIFTGIRLLLMHKTNLQFRSKLLDGLLSNDLDYLVYLPKAAPTEELSRPVDSARSNESNHKQVIKMSACDTARAAYESSRNEILERIRLRDNALLAFLGATGVIFSVTATGITSRPEFLLVLPYLSLGATSIISQHDRTIGGISAFITQELEPFLHEHDEDAPTWESCKFLHQYNSTAIVLRSISHSILVLMPAILALVWSWSATTISRFLQSVWWFALAVTVIAAFLLVSTHFARRKYYRETTWRSADSEARN